MKALKQLQSKQINDSTKIKGGTSGATDMLDIDGKPVGDQQEFEVSVDPQSV